MNENAAINRESAAVLLDGFVDTLFSRESFQSDSTHDVAKLRSLMFELLIAESPEGVKTAQLKLRDAINKMYHRRLNL